MAVRGVLVSCRPPGGQDNTKNIVSSGVLFADKWVLTLGTILEPIIYSENTQNQAARFFKSQNSHHLTVVPLSLHSTNSFPSFSVLIEDNETYSSDVNVKEIRRVDVPLRKRHRAHLAAVWKCPLVTQAVNTVLNSWQLDPDQEKPQNETFNKLLSTILLFKINYDDIPKKHTLGDVNKGIDVLIQEVDIPKRGQNVIIESTLFGSEFFMNSLSQGIISNVLGPNNCMLLTDARSGLGCEGGPIFFRAEGRSLQQRHLLGLVLSSVSWWKGEWVGFTLGLALHPILCHLRSQSNEPTIPLTIRPASSLGNLDKGVVLVRCGLNWGTGVVVNASLGLILTCSHIVHQRESDVSVVWGSGDGNVSVGVTRAASLLYRTRDGVAYDIAILRVTPPPHIQQAVISRLPPVKGEVVFVVGYPMFSETDNPSLRATLTRGIISHVTSPVMLQTTCCVQSGASGGPVVRPNGEVLAIISCNAKDTNTGALYPHVNMAIPALVFEEPIRRFVETHDVKEFSLLENDNEFVQNMWKLNITTCKM